MGANPLVAVMLPTPSADDLNFQRGLSGGMGWYVFKNFIEPAGFEYDNLIVSHVIRCKPPRDKRGRQSYPTGITKKRAEAVCRKYDSQHGHEGVLTTGGVATWSPTMCLLTLNPSDVHQNPSYFRQIQRDMERAMMLVENGFRPLVLMGKEPAELFAPHIVGNGGLKGWRGDYFEIAPNELLVSQTPNDGMKHFMEG